MNLFFVLSIVHVGTGIHNRIGKSARKPKSLRGVVKNILKWWFLKDSLACFTNTHTQREDMSFLVWTFRNKNEEDVIRFETIERDLNKSHLSKEEPIKVKGVKKTGEYSYFLRELIFGRENPSLRERQESQETHYHSEKGAEFEKWREIFEKRYFAVFQ